MIWPPAFHFSTEPTARGDDIATYARQWYEANRESWRDRHRPRADRKGEHADEWMLRFLGAVGQIYDAARLSTAERKP